MTVLPEIQTICSLRKKQKYMANVCTIDGRRINTRKKHKRSLCYDQTVRNSHVLFYIFCRRKCVGKRLLQKLRLNKVNK